MKTSGNTILVTGGGSGIGAGIAQRLHDRGDKVIIAGRRRDALEQTCAGRPNMYAFTLDIDDAAAIRQFAEQVKSEHPALNILINNAGIMRYERLQGRRDLADAEQTVVTNLLGPIRLIDALVDHLASQPDAGIINVTSGLAFVPLPGAPTYSATKAALHSYTLALRERLRGRVEVMELAPPGVRTDLTPGQSTRDGYMPLDAFLDEVMSLLEQEPTPSEILVQQVLPLRHAEANGQLDAALSRLGALVPVD